MEIIKNVDLHCTNAGADKVYHCALVKAADGYMVEFAYGRRGSMLTRGTKTSNGPVPLTKAEQIFAKLVNEKISKGYVASPGISGTVFAGQVASSDNSSDISAGASSFVSEKESTGIFPQLLNPIGDDEVSRLIEDPEWGAQEKKDGRRHMVWHKPDGRILGINRMSFVVPMSPLLMAAVAGIGGSLLLDSEAIGDTLHCFGILEHDGRDFRGMPYIEMHSILSAVLEGHTGNYLEVVPLAITTQEKRALYLRLKAEKAEGIVFKRLAAPYTPDRPASGGDHLKKKFTERASVIVLGVNEGKRSIRMGVYAGKRRG